MPNFGESYPDIVTVIPDLTSLISETAKIPKSDSTVSWNATALAEIQNRDLAALLTVGNGRIIGSGTFTTDSASAPADTSRTEANNYWWGCTLIPLTGAVAGQPRRIVAFTQTGGIFTLSDASGGGFTAAPGLVAYIIVADYQRIVYEDIGWFPNASTTAVKETGDLEAATKTITRTTEASGVGSADYSSAQTLTTVPYLNLVASTLAACRLDITRMAARLSVTIDSDDGTHDLRCRVYVDAQNANNLLFDVTCTTTGNQLAVQATLVGTKETIFNLLKDGAAHTFYFFFWSPGNHSPVISVCELWYGIGSVGTNSNPCLNLTMKGNASVKVHVLNAISGTVAAMVTIYVPFTDTLYTYLIGANSTAGFFAQITQISFVLTGKEKVYLYAGAATDLVVIDHLALGLLSEV